MRSMLTNISFGVLSLGMGLGPAIAGPAALLPHRAVYDLSLKEASERSGINNMFGRMVYEFNGSACDGYTVSFRFVTEIDTGEAVRLADQQTTTYENIRDRTFNFITKSYVNESLDHEIKGKAALEGEDLKVEIDKPTKSVIDLPAARFPTAHMMELIDKAKDGQQFYQSRIFDGSDEADESLITTTVLGKLQTAMPVDAETKAATSLAKKDFWPVAISYFNEKNKDDGIPIYSIAFKLYENGVTRDLTMDYGDFSLTGKLAELKLFDPTPCAQ